MTDTKLRIRECSFCGVRHPESFDNSNQAIQFEILCTLRRIAYALEFANQAAQERDRK